MVDFKVYGKIACILCFEHKQPGELLKIEKKDLLMINNMCTSGSGDQFLD